MVTLQKGLDETLSTLSTGDVLLYRTNDLGATFNSCMQRSFWSHVGLVVRGNPEVLRMLFPTDYMDVDHANDALCVFEAVPRRGVSLFPLKDRLARTIKTTRILAVRRRTGAPITSEQMAKLEAFMREVRGRKLEMASRDMVRALCCGLQRSEHENWDEFFCSELVAEALQQLGVLQEEQLNSNDVLPRNFDSNHSLLATKCLAGNSYADEERLIGPGKSEVVQALKAHKDESKRRRAQASLGSRDAAYAAPASAPTAI